MIHYYKIVFNFRVKWSRLWLVVLLENEPPAFSLIHRTRETLASGHFMSVINILMQLRKVCNHPNLFDPRPIQSPFITQPIVFRTASLVQEALEISPLKVSMDGCLTKLLFAAQMSCERMAIFYLFFFCFNFPALWPFFIWSCRFGAPCHPLPGGRLPAAPQSQPPAYTGDYRVPWTTAETQTGPHEGQQVRAAAKIIIIIIRQMQNRSDRQVMYEHGRERELYTNQGFIEEKYPVVLQRNRLNLASLSDGFINKHTLLYFAARHPKNNDCDNMNNSYLIFSLFWHFSDIVSQKHFKVLPLAPCNSESRL